jgi:hypothetical protein
MEDILRPRTVIIVIHVTNWPLLMLWFWHTCSFPEVSPKLAEISLLGLGLPQRPFCWLVGFPCSRPQLFAKCSHGTISTCRRRRNGLGPVQIGQNLKCNDRFPKNNWLLSVSVASIQLWATNLEKENNCSQGWSPSCPCVNTARESGHLFIHYADYAFIRWQTGNSESWALPILNSRVSDWCAMMCPPLCFVDIIPTE